MADLLAFVEGWLAIFFVAFVLLLAFGANIAPSWAKSRAFLWTACGLVIIGSNIALI